MITPRRTRLIRVQDLQAFRQVIVKSVSSSNPSRVVVVPTVGAAAELRRLVKKGSGGDPFSTRDGLCVTREGLYDAFHRQLNDPPRRLTPHEREAMMRASTREAFALVRDGGDPEALRAQRDDGRQGERIESGPSPSLVAANLNFYDQLRRLGQQVARFEELLREALASDAEFDRGADRLLRQTDRLTAAFRSYERKVEASGGYDEHLLRRQLVAEPSSSPIRAAIITVADWIGEPGGLYPADFDLLARIPGLETLDVVATQRILESGFHQRLHEWLPGLDEVDGDTSPRRRPRLVTPAAPPERWAFTARDREEELIDVSRRIDLATADRAAVVYKRPLPYVYLAREILGGARIPYTTSDTTPLAAEPFSAALDLVIELVASPFTRDAIVSLLRSPHFVWEGRMPVSRDAIAALDRELRAARYLGDLDQLSRLSTEWESTGSHPAALPAIRAALAAAGELAPLAAPAPASTHIARVVSFLEAHRAPDEERVVDDRERRGRTAILDTLESLATASRAHDDAPVAVDGLAALIRRGIEEQTFAATSTAAGGLHLVDDQAARYGDFDEITLVGLIEGEWPERPPRTIFYSSSLLSALGWPSEKDWRRAAEARFLDLLGSSSERVMLSTITLDDEALVEVSTFVDEVPRAGLASVAIDPPPDRRLLDEPLSLDPPDLDGLDHDARSWAEMRLARSNAGDPAFHGQAGPVARTWSVSALETYLDCPFKFFARHVLKLEEEPDDDEVMDSKQQGQFVHAVFERFFERWRARGRQAVTPGNLDEARAVFTEVVDESVRHLSDTEAALQRTQLLGSSAAAGLGEAVLRMEAERPVGVSSRLLEHRLEGEFTFQTDEGPRLVRLRGKADRVDLLEDGTFRLIDYKLGWPPNRARALQLPIYSLCAEQQLAGLHGRTWQLSEAAYLAFKGPKRVVPLFSPGDRDRALREAQQRLIDALDAIERGEFPPRPQDVYRCETCAYAAVCRKDYVGDV